MSTPYKPRQRQAREGRNPKTKEEQVRFDLFAYSSRLCSLPSLVYHP